MFFLKVKWTFPSICIPPWLQPDSDSWSWRKLSDYQDLFSMLRAQNTAHQLGAMRIELAARELLKAKFQGGEIFAKQ